MRKPKLRDWFLLLVPVVLLAGFAFWRQQNEKPPEPFRLVVKQIRHEKLTPLEVYEGFDTKIAVVVGHKGTKPDWWTPSKDAKSEFARWRDDAQNPPRFMSHDKSLTIHNPKDQPWWRYSLTEDCWTRTYLCRTKEVAFSRIIFRDGYALFKVTEVTTGTQNLDLAGKLNVNQFVVRQHKDSMPRPAVLKEPSFRVIDFQFGKRGGVLPDELYVNLTLQCKGPKSNTRAILHQLPDYKGLHVLKRQMSYQGVTVEISKEGYALIPKGDGLQGHHGFLIDEQGRYYPSHVATQRVGGGPSNRVYPSYSFIKSQIPPKGKLRFRALVTVNDSWPLEINEIVRR